MKNTNKEVTLSYYQTVNLLLIMNAKKDVAAKAGDEAEVEAFEIMIHNLLRGAIDDDVYTIDLDIAERSLLSVCAADYKGFLEYAGLTDAIPLIDDILIKLK